MVLYSKGLLPARTGLCQKYHYTLCFFQFFLGLKIALTDGHHYAQTHERMITRHWGLCSLIFSFGSVYFLCSRRGDEKWRRRGQRLNITDKMKHLNFLWVPEIFSFTEPRQVLTSWSRLAFAASPLNFVPTHAQGTHTNWLSVVMLEFRGTGQEYWKCS